MVFPTSIKTKTGFKAAESTASFPNSKKSPLYFYVKSAHVSQVPGLPEYIAEFTSERAAGPDGYLIDKGLIPLPDAERKKVRTSGANLVPLKRPND